MSETTRPLSKTDMILLQTETEKLARTAHARISKERPGIREENAIVLEWIIGSVASFMKVMPLKGIQCLAKRIKEYEMERRNTKLGGAYQNFEINEK